MQLDRDALNAACYEFVRTMRWKDNAVDDVVARAIVSSYAEKALFHAKYLLDQDRDPNILVRAIQYLTQSHAMPPLEGDLAWFQAALDVLVELACPNTVVGPEAERFFCDLEQGIADARSGYQT
jgi:hypothetical protein